MQAFSLLSGISAGTFPARGLKYCLLGNPICMYGLLHSGTATEKKHVWVCDDEEKHCVRNCQIVTMTYV